MIKIIDWKLVNSIIDISFKTPLVVYGEISLFDESKIQLLSANEISRGKKMHLIESKVFFASHICLRQLLSAFLNINPDELKFNTTQNGKPYLNNSDLHFNMSHSKTAFAIAISKKKVGIDIEDVNININTNDIAKYAYSEAEQLYCSQIENFRAFNEIWTLKEAFLKAEGLGLTDNLPEIDVIKTNNVIQQNEYKNLSFETPNHEIGSIVYKQNQADFNFYFIKKL